MIFFDFSDVKKTLQLLPWWVGPLSQGLALTVAELVWNRGVSVCSLCGFFAFYVFLILSRLDPASPLWCFLYQYLFASFYIMFTPWFYHDLILFTFYLVPPWRFWCFFLPTLSLWRWQMPIQRVSTVCGPLTAMLQSLFRGDSATETWQSWET